MSVELDECCGPSIGFHVRNRATVSALIQFRGKLNHALIMCVTCVIRCATVDSLVIGLTYEH